MKVKYNEEENYVLIDDGFKTQYWLINSIAILNIINAVLYPVLILQDKHSRSFGFIWVVIGILSLAGLIYQLSKKSAASKLQLSEIQWVKEKEFIGRRSLRLHLTNGKSRDLTDFKDHKDFVATKELFGRIGIKSV